MAIYKCKICGGALEIDTALSVALCEYCGTKQTLPKLDDERRANLYDRANHFRRGNEFDKAMAIYESILNEDATDAEAYWSLVLCRWGIEYVEDPKTKKRIPTVNRAQFTSIFDDEDYKSAIANADASQREIYQAEAETINEIQKGILAISEKEEPFDVFICYKETDQNGRRTHDSVLATELYHELTREGFKVFFSRITLEDKLGVAYEPYIFAALHSSKVMVALGTRPEHFNSVWVKNEWSRYLAIIKGGARKTLVPAYRDMDPYDLPEEFSHLQALDMSKLGFMQDLVRGVKKIVGSSQQKAQPKASVVTEAASTAPAIAPLLKRAFIFLEDGEFDRADDFAEQVLNQDPECAEAYVIKMMIDVKANNKEELTNSEVSIENNKNYQKAIRFADEKLSSELGKIVATINERVARKIEEEFKEKIYRDSTLIYYKSTHSPSYIPKLEAAIKDLTSISGYKDSDDFIERCHKEINQIREKAEKARLESKIAREEEAKRKKRNKKIAKITALILIPLIIVTVTGIIIYKNVFKYPEIDGIQYEKISGGYRVAEYVGDDTEIVIPDEVRGKPVIEIGDSAFYHNRNLSSVTIPDSVTTISDFAFSGCTSLESVTIPDSVTTIGGDAFYGCDSLESVTIGDRVTTIGIAAFFDCTSLESVTIGNSVTTIDNSAFYGCDSLESITIPDSVTTIGVYAFNGCASLTSLTIPDSVTTISDSAFRNCSNLKSVIIGNNVTTIGDFAFSDCASLTNLTVPDSVTSIGASAFYGCSNLTSVTIPDSVTTIGEYAFYYCSSLTSVTIGDSVRTIGDEAFSYCDSLTSVYITDIASWCGISFANYSSNPLYYAKKLYLDGESITNLIIPESVTAIGSYAFSGCTSLTSVTIGDSVRTIDSSAFSKCTSLTSITIPDSVTTIGSSAFYDCDSIMSVTIGDSVTTIGEYAFCDCDSLTSVTIGDSVTSIGDCAFSYCTSLTSVTIGDSVRTIGEYAFYGCSKLKTVINKSSLDIRVGSSNHGYVAYYANTVIKE